MLSPYDPMETRRYPEWRARLKPRGKRDKSLKSRSNRCKAQRKARG